MKQAEPVGGTVPPSVVAPVLRLAMLLVLLRSPLVLLSLFWLRGSEMMALGCQVVRIF